MLNAHHSPAHLSCSFHFTLSAPSASETVSVETKSSFLVIFSSQCGYFYGCHTQSLIVFHFQGSGLPKSFSGVWSDDIHKAHIALQELQVFALMMHIEWLFSYLVRQLLYIWVLQILIHVIKLVEYLLFFPD